MNKRGASHVEMIIAFVLFTGFLISALIFFSPTRTSRLVDSTLAYAFNEIQDASITRLTTYSIKIKENTEVDPPIPAPDIIPIKFPNQPYCYKDENKWCLGADTDQDGTVDAIDLEFVRIYFGKACKDIPEETAKTICLIAYNGDQEHLVDANLLANVRNFFGGNQLNNVIVKARQGERLSSYRNQDNVFFKIVLSDFTKTDFAILKFSLDIHEIQDSAIAVQKDPSEFYPFFEIASSQVTNPISEKKMIILNKNYYEDYEELKGPGQNNFNLPSRTDFAFSLVFSDTEKIEATRQIPEGLDAYTESKRVEVLRTDGEIAFADLIVTIW